MIRTLVFVGALVALSTPALARDIRVSLVGKTPDQVHSDIRRAAERVCDEALRFSVGALANRSSCVAEAVARTEAQLPADFAVGSAAVASR